MAKKGKARRSKKHKKSKNNKIQDQQINEFDTVIKGIVDMYNMECVSTHWKSKTNTYYLRFTLKSIGSSTQDKARLYVSHFIDKQDKIVHYALSFVNVDVDANANADTESPTKPAQQQELYLGKKILLSHIKDDDELRAQIRTNGYYAVSSSDIAGTMHDLLVCIAESNYLYFDICALCLKDNAQRLTRPQDLQTYDSMYHRLCPTCIDNHVVNNNMVTIAYRKDPNIVKFLLLLSLDALDSTDRFTPFPTFKEDHKEFKTYGESVKYFANISREIDWWIDILDKVIDNSGGDWNAYEQLGINAYRFIKFVIESNNTILGYFDTNFCAANESDRMLLRDLNVWDNSDLIVFAVTHDADKEDLFNRAPKTTYLYHGSPSYNWHSILRNGLKNYSGSGKQSHGAAYGAGIYLASNNATSEGYSLRGKNQFTVISIAQVLDAETYSKGGAIYVVPDESKVLIKYMILCKGEANRSRLAQIYEYLTHTLPKSLDFNRGCMAGITGKRLTNEFEQLQEEIRKLSDSKTIKIGVTNHEVVCGMNDGKDEDDAEEGEEGEEGKEGKEGVTEENLIASLKARKWEVRITQEKRIIIINVDISYQYPLVPPKIGVISREPIDRSNIPLLFEDGDSKKSQLYRYVEPVMIHGSWKPQTKISSIVDFLAGRIANQM